MSWNIEIAVIEPGLNDLNDLGLVDVSQIEPETAPFWEVSSSSLPERKMGIAFSPERIILVDPHARLYKALKSLTRDVGNRQVTFARVSDSNLCEVIIAGHEMSATEIQQQYLNAQESPQIAGMDGEQLAWHFLKQTTGLDLNGAGDNNLNNISFRVFGP